MQFDLNKILATEYLGQDKPVNKIKPVVSVCVITYNHAAYIEKCLDSILAQKTDFDFEILIGEDNSTDNTRAICMSYAEKYSDKIRLFLRTSEQKIDVEGKKTWHYNFVAHLYTSKAEYIAWCDGDDYWTDPLKLQKQFDLLNADESLVMINHHFNKLWDDGTLRATKVKPNTISRTEDIIAEFKVRMSTMMFRNIFSNHPLPEWFYKNQVGDVTLSIYLSLFGNIYYLEDNMAVYRVSSPNSVLALGHSQRHLHGAQMYSYLLEDELFADYSNTLKRRILVFLRRYLLEKDSKSNEKKSVLSRHKRMYSSLSPKTTGDIKDHLRFISKYYFNLPKLRTL